MVPIKVLQFGRFDFDDIKGGVQFYAESIARGADSTVTIDQLVSGMNSKTKVSETSRGLKVVVPNYGDLLSVPISPGLILWAQKLWRKKKYDVIHLNFPDPLAMIAVWFLPKGIPVVVTWHSDIVRQKLALKIYMPFLRMFMRRVRKILVATPLHLESCAQLKSLKMDEKVVVIEFGVDAKKFELTSAVEKKRSEVVQMHSKHFLLFTFGRHVYYKGFEYLIRSMSLTTHCHLILGGSGPLTESLKELTRELKLESRVFFVGSVPEEQIPAYLYACDVFCFPSVDISEAFGYTQLEAMMCGKPVITCHLGNGVNYVTADGETGLTVPTRDPRAFAKAIRKLQENPEFCQKLGRQARERAHRLFLIQRTVERTIQLFKDLVQSELF